MKTDLVWVVDSVAGEDVSHLSEEIVPEERIALLRVRKRSWRHERRAGGVCTYRTVRERDDAEARVDLQ